MKQTHMFLYYFLQLTVNLETPLLLMSYITCDTSTQSCYWLRDPLWFVCWLDWINWFFFAGKYRLSFCTFVKVLWIYFFFFKSLFSSNCCLTPLLIDPPIWLDVSTYQPPQSRDIISSSFHVSRWSDSLMVWRCFSKNKKNFPTDEEKTKANETT